MMRRCATAAACLFVWLQPAPGHAQEEAAPVEVPAIPGEVIAEGAPVTVPCTVVEGEKADLVSVTNFLLLRGLDCVESFRKSTEETFAVVRSTLESPETQSRLLNRFLEGDHGWQFLKDVNFRVKAFESETLGEAALGFSYDYSKSVQSHDLSCSRDACIRGLDLQLMANGNVAADADRNPSNFLETQLSFAWFQSTGGVSAPTAEHRKQFQGLRREFIEAEGDSDEEERAVRNIEALVRPLLSDQIYWEIAGDAAFESDQQFESRQWAYGVHAMFEIKAWNDASALAKFNLLDYPFAALRALSGYEICAGGGSSCFKPRGTAWPSVLAGLDRVSGAENTPRELAGVSSDYDRLRLEASFRTPVARYGDDELFISVNYRYYEELDAPPSVQVLDLDSFEFFTVVLGGEDGIYVSYSDGRLPFDLADDQVFALGYQFHR